jgi:hypothetical protein
VIIRILGEGQFTVADDEVDRLNELDAQVEAAIVAGDEAAFGPALAALLGHVRATGTAVAADELVASDAVLPPSDALLGEARDMLREDGLIPR